MWHPNKRTENIDVKSSINLGHTVPQGSQPWWWPPGCQSCIHPPQSAAHLLKGCWHETGMGCWLPGSPLCGSHNRTGRTRHRHWAHNILAKNDIQSVNSVYSSTEKQSKRYAVIQSILYYIKLHTHSNVITKCSYNFCSFIMWRYNWKSTQTIVL